MFKARRCDECRRRKKRCVIPEKATGCNYCLKKGVPCVLKEDGLQIVHYNPEHNDAMAHQDGPFISSGPPVKRRSEGSIGCIFVDGASIAKPPKSVSRRGSSISQTHPDFESTNVTTHSLISVINKIKTDGQQHDCGQESLRFTNMARVYLPKRDFSSSPGLDGPVFNDELIRSSVSETLKVPEKLPLVDFLLSSIRIHSLEGLSDDPAKLLSLALGEIKTFLDTDKKTGGVVDLLRERGYLVSTQGQATTEQDETEAQIKRERRLSHAVSESGVPNSIDTIDLTVDTDRLSDAYFIEQAGITLENGNRKFCEVVGDAAFNDVISAVLFDHFCGITPMDPNFVEQGTPDEKMTTPPESHKLDPLLSHAPKTYLAVVLPLIAGNATALKSAILLGYHHWMKFNPDDVMSVLRDDMERLHMEVMCELKERLFNTTSLCCDHTILCVILLLNLECNIKGMRGSLWSKLLVLLHTLIKFRGGIRELATTLTGLCLMRLMSAHLCVGMLSFKPESLETHEVINLNDFTYLLDLKPHYQFYDMLNFKPDLCPGDINVLLKTYANVFQLHNLSDISYFANTKVDTQEFGDYDSMSTQNLEYAVDQSEQLAMQIKQALRETNVDYLADKYKVQYVFALRASLLCLYQMVFRFNSLTPKTVLAVKALLGDVEAVFNTFAGLSEEEAQGSLVFVVPLVTLGIDIVSARRREWFMDNLEMMYAKTRKEPLRTAIDVLKDVWVSNVTGVSYVDGRALAEEKGVMVPFCA